MKTHIYKVNLRFYITLLIIYSSTSGFASALNKTITFQVQKGNDYYLSRSTLEITELKNGKTRLMKCGNDGKLTLDMTDQQRVLVRAYRKGFMHSEQEFDIESIEDPKKSLKIRMSPVEIGEVIRYKKMSFDDGALLSNASTHSSLNSITRLLSIHKDIEIELGTHYGTNLDHHTAMDQTVKMIKSLESHFSNFPELTSRITYHAYGKTKLVSRPNGESKCIVELLIKRKLNRHKFEDIKGLQLLKESPSSSNQNGKVSKDALENAINGLMKKVQFRPGSDLIENASLAFLGQVVKLIGQGFFEYIEVSGHTDNVGSKDFNTNLSFLRAERTKSYLVELGISESRLITVGHGESQPLASNQTEEGRSENRRVEIRFINDYK